MGRDSSGTYTRTQSDYVFNTVIQETQINSELNDLAAEITASLEASGKKTWTGNQNAGSTKITDLAVGTANTDSTTIGQTQDGGAQYAAGTGTDTITATMAPAITAYAAGQTFRIKQAAGANTGATTLNLNGLGAKAITKRGTTALAAGDIPASTMFEVAYDGTQFQLLNVGNGITASSPDTLTNKSIDLTNNTVTGTLAELNTAISDATLVDGALAASNNLSDLGAASTARTNLGVAIGTDVQAYDVDTLKADTADVLTAGFAVTDYDAGTKSSGTYTPDEANGNVQKFVNGGAHTLAPPTNSCTLVLQQTNNASAGTITTSGFTLVDGDDFTTTNGHDFFLYITKVSTFSLLSVKALQ
jgi:hypothetical protein